jgi:hypothetical protein
MNSELINYVDFYFCITLKTFRNESYPLNRLKTPIIKSFFFILSIFAIKEFAKDTLCGA